MTIKEILEAHESRLLNYACSCGAEFPPPNEHGRPYLKYRAHVAQVLDQHMQEREAVAVRETARNIERLYPRKGLINRADLLADIEIAADRLGRGIHANGRDKRPANGR